MMTTALWPFADVPKKMTLVHGRCLLPLVKSRSEALTSLRGVYLSPFLTDLYSGLLYQMCQIPRPRHDAVVRATTRAFVKPQNAANKSLAGINQYRPSRSFAGKLDYCPAVTAI